MPARKTKTKRATKRRTVPRKSSTYKVGKTEVATIRIGGETLPRSMKVHTGPRGGKYILRNGRKVYLK